MLLDRLPIAAWRLDDTGSTAVDSIGSLDGTHNSGVTPNVSAKINTGSAYDGSATGFTTMGNADLIGRERTQPFSISFWMKFDTVTNTKGVLISRSAGPGTRRGWYVGMLSGGGLYCHIVSDFSVNNYLGQDSAGAGIEDGNIHHVVISYDGTGIASGLKFYIDGALMTSLVARDTLTNTIVDSGAEFVIATYGPSGNRAAPTSLDFFDDVAFFEVALSEQEIYQIYKAGLFGISIADFTNTTISTNSGHELDNNTVALWRFDEVASYGHSQLKTSKSEINTDNCVIQPTSGQAPQICGGPDPDGSMNARWFDGNNSLASVGTINSTIHTLLTSAVDYSVECWIYWSADDSTDTIFEIGGDPASELEVDNLLFSIRIDNGSGSEKIEINWEHSAGTNVSYISSTALPFSKNDGWHHITVNVEDAGAGTCNVSIYIDGALHDSTTGLTRASGGTNSLITIGAQRGHLNLWMGSIADIRMSNIVRDGSIPTNYQHTSDANTVEIWRLNEPPEVNCLTKVLDISPHLNSRRDVVNPDTLDSVSGLIRGNGYSRYATGGGIDEYLEFSGTEELRQVFIGEWTWEGWIQLGENPTTSQKIIMAWDASGETSATNVLFVIRYNRSTNQFEVFWENGAGINVATTFNTIRLLNPSFGQNKRHVAVTKTDEGSGASYQLDLYVDGAHIETLTGIDPADGGEDASLFLGSGVGGAQPWEGRIDDIRLSNVVRTASEIQTSYERGLAATGASTRYYLMAAIDDNASGGAGEERPFYRTWKVQDEPDPTSALYTGSFFGASINFINIYVQATWLE